MVLFKSKEEKEMMLNSMIEVKTKDELLEAIKKGYGTIVPTGPLADKLVAKVIELYPLRLLLQLLHA